MHHNYLKPKWRRVHEQSYSHCFVRKGRAFVPLCGRHEARRSGGAEVLRPNPYARCPLCDMCEIDRFGKEESLPATITGVPHVILVDKVGSD